MHPWTWRTTPHLMPGSTARSMPRPIPAAGAPAWTQTFSVSRPSVTMNSSVAVASDGSVVAALTSDGARVFDGAGAALGTVSGLSPAPQGVSVASDGTVGLLVRYNMPAGVANLAVARYSSAGTSLGLIAPLAGDYQGAFAFAAMGAVGAVTTGSGHSTISLTTGASVNVFSAQENTGTGAAATVGAMVLSNGDVVEARQQGNTGLFTGLRVRAYSPTGTSVMALLESPTTMSPPFVDGVSPVAVSAGGTYRFAAAGTYAGTGWIQVFDLP